MENCPSDSYPHFATSSMQLSWAAPKPLALPLFPCWASRLPVLVGIEVITKSSVVTVCPFVFNVPTVVIGYSAELSFCCLCVNIHTLMCCDVPGSNVLCAWSLGDIRGPAAVVSVECYKPLSKCSAVVSIWLHLLHSFCHNCNYTQQIRTFIFIPLTPSFQSLP